MLSTKIKTLSVLHFLAICTTKQTLAYYNALCKFYNVRIVRIHIWNDRIANSTTYIQCLFLLILVLHRYANYTLGPDRLIL